MTPLERLAWLVMVAGLVQGHGPSMVVAVLLAEAAKTDDSGDKCWPKVAGLSSMCGFNETTVARAIQRLQTLGVVVVGRRLGHSNFYTLVSPDTHTAVTMTPVGRATTVTVTAVGGATAVTMTPVTPSLKTEDIREDSKKENTEKKDNIYIRENESTTPKAPRFTPPALEEIQAYCEERGNTVDAERFFAHYESNGWMVGKNKMKNWKASVWTWEKNDRAKAASTCPYPPNSTAWYNWHILNSASAQ